MRRFKRFTATLVGLTTVAISTGHAGDTMKAGLSPSGGGGQSASSDFVVVGSVALIGRMPARGGAFVVSPTGSAAGQSPAVFLDGFEGGAQ